MHTNLNYLTQLYDIFIKTINKLIRQFPLLMMHYKLNKIWFLGDIFVLVLILLINYAVLFNIPFGLHFIIWQCVLFGMSQ